MRKRIEFHLSIPSLIALTVLLITYLFAYILQLNGLSSSTLFLCFFIQTFSLILFSIFYLRKFSNDYFNKSSSHNVSIILNCWGFSILVMFFLFLFDYMFSLFTDFYLSHGYGKLIDKMLEDPNSTKIEVESFAILPLTLQNIFLNVICFPALLFISYRFLKNKIVG